MEYKQFKYILKIAEVGNLTKAAEELYITQPSLSHYVARVEEELGVRLFNRNTNPISLTLAGERYCETARMILSLDEKLKKDVSDIANDQSGIINLGISHARASYFLPYILPDFIERYPGIDIRTHEQKSVVVEENVSKGICDMGVLPMPLSGKYDLQVESIMKEELLLVSGKELKHGHDAGKRDYVDFSDIEGMPFILLKAGHGIRLALETIFMEHDLHPGKVFETTSNETAYRLSTADVGISIVPESTILLSSAVSKPYIYRLTEKGLFWHIAVIYKDKDYLTAPQKYFIEIMKNNITERSSYLESCNL